MIIETLLITLLMLLFVVYIVAGVFASKQGFAFEFALASFATAVLMVSGLLIFFSCAI